MLLPEFVQVCRGSAAKEESFLCLSREVVMFATHYVGYSVLCPGSSCALCERGFKQTRGGAVVGGSKSGDLALLLCPAETFRRSQAVLGHVFSHAPWRRGQAVKWTISDEVRLVRTDQVVENSQVLRCLLRMFLPESKRGHGDGCDTLTAARNILIEVARNLAARTTFDF